MEPWGSLVNAQLPVNPTGQCAWSQSLGLIALGGSRPSGEATVAIVDPSCPDEFCELNLDSGTSDQVVSLSWTAPDSRHALLTGTRQGRLTVWSQVPQDVQGAPMVPCINQWFGHTLATSLNDSNLSSASTVLGAGYMDDLIALAVAEADAPPSSSSSGASGAPQLVHAAWLAPLPCRHWSSAALAQAPQQPTVYIDDLFAAPARRPHSQLELRHWMRASLLCAAVVDSGAGLRFWWATMGRHPSQLHWQSSGRITLLTGVQGVAQPPSVTAANAITAAGTVVRTALVTTAEPTTVFICEVSGDPTCHGNINLPADKALRASVLARVDLTLSLPDRVLLPPTNIQLKHGLHGTTLYVLAGEETAAKGQASLPANEDGAGVASQGYTSHVLMFKQQSGVVDASAPVTWSPRADLMHSVPDPAPPHSLCVSNEGSKVAWLSGSDVHVLNSEDLIVLLAPQPSTPSSATHTQQPQSPSQPSPSSSSSSCCFSPLSCAVAIFCAGDGVGWRHTQPETKGGSKKPPTGRLKGARLQILPVLDVPAENSYLGPLPRSPLEPMSDATWETHARLEAARMALCVLEGLPTWCLAQRAAAVARGYAGWWPTFRSLALLDDIIHHEDSHPRPVYSSMADRVKLAVLRVMPGAGPASVAADICTRAYISMLHHMLTTCVPLRVSDPASKPTSNPEEVALVKHWLSWFGDYIQLMLASLRAWSEAHARLPQSTPTRATHVSNPGVTEQVIAQGAAEVAEEEGPGAAWAYWQEAHEAGGPLSVEEAAVTLPCLRLLMDRKVLLNLRYIIQMWTHIRSSLPSQPTDGPDDTEEGAQAQHDLYVKMKQFQPCIEAIVALRPDVPPQSGHVAQPTPQELTATLQRLYPGRVQLHGGRCTLLSTHAHLQPLFSSPPVIAAAPLTPRQLLARARELGLLLAPQPPLWPAGAGNMSERTISAWQQFRGPAPAPALHAPLLMLAPQRLGAAPVQGGYTAPTTTSTVDIMRVLVTPGTTAIPPTPFPQTQMGDAQGVGAAADPAGPTAAASRRRWRQQRAVALGTADPASERSSLRYRSKVAAAAELEQLPLLDMVTAVRLHPSTAGWSVEAVDGSGVTCQLEDAVLQAPTTLPTVLQYKRGWLAACPITGAAWKRARPMAAAAHDMVPEW